jgi:DNA primase
VLDGSVPQSPEAVARLGEAAMTVVNEHPNRDIRKLYAGEVALRVGLPVDDLVAVAERGTRRPQVTVRAPRARSDRRHHGEFVAIALLVQEWDSIAPWLVEALFSDEVNRRAFLAVAESSGVIDQALELADPEARDVIERAAVVDLDVDAEAEARNLIAAAVRRDLAAHRPSHDPDLIRRDAQARVQMEELNDRDRSLEAAGWLLGWLEGREEADDHGG